MVIVTNVYETLSFCDKSEGVNGIVRALNHASKSVERRIKEQAPVGVRYIDLCLRSNPATNTFDIVGKLLLEEEKEEQERE